MTKKSIKVEEEKGISESNPLIIEGSLPYRIVITGDEYKVDYDFSVANELAAVMIARKITEQIKSDMELFKKMKVKQSPADKKHSESRYDKLIHSSYSLATISDEILAEALGKVSK